MHLIAVQVMRSKYPARTRVGSGGYDRHLNSEGQCRGPCYCLATYQDCDGAFDVYSLLVHINSLKHLQDIPEGRRVSALRTVWRRIYIHDEYVRYNVLHVMR